MSYPSDQPFTRADAERGGLTRSRLATLVRQGTVRHVLRDVYVAGVVPDSTLLRASAISLVVSPDHVVVDRSAAWLHGVDALTGQERALLPALEVCAFRSRHPTRRTEVRTGERDLTARDITVIAGVRATTQLRTAMDLGCRLKRREAYAVLNDFARIHGIDRRAIDSDLDRFKGRRGVIQLRELVQLIEPCAESARESWTLLAIIDANLPRPMPQYEVMGYRLDFAYPQSRVAVEYDGFDHHSDDLDRAYDERRRQDLTDAGWRIVVVRTGDFSGDRLDHWLRELRSLLVPAYSAMRW